MLRVGALRRRLGLLVGDVSAGPQRVWLVALLALQAALVPLAHASPPDPLWISGIYDDADYDEAVVAIIFDGTLVETLVAPARPSDIALGTVWHHVPLLAGAPPFQKFCSRAPPSAPLRATQPPFGESLSVASS